MPLVSNADHLHPRRLAAYARVRDVLRKWDPIGVICEANQDEYDSYAQEFVSWLDRQVPVDQIVGFMRHLSVDRMGLGAFDEPHARSCASELVQFWRSWKDG